MNRESAFLDVFESEGSVLLEGILSEETIRVAKALLEQAVEAEAGYHGRRDHVDYAMVLCCAMYGRVFIDLLTDEEIIWPFEAVLGEGCILYAYTSSSMPPDTGNFSGRVHVDCPRLIPGYPTNMGAILLLDDFDEENGGTWYLPRSHRRREAPEEAEFYADALRLVAKAGSVWYFDPRLWHAGGRNEGDIWRHAVTMNMCRPFMKQRLDIPRLLADTDLAGVSERALQKLGFHAQAPASLDEYYAPPQARKFKQPYE